MSICSFEQLTTLTLPSLDLSHQHIGDEGARILAVNTTLTTLHLRHNNIGDAGAKALAANTTLRALNLGYNNIGAEGIHALAANNTLTTLDLTGNGLGAAEARILATNTTLTTLKLWANHVGTEGAQALAANTTLTSLDLTYNKVEDAGVQALAQRCYRFPYHTLLGLSTFFPELAIVKETRTAKWKQRRIILAKEFIATRTWLAEDHHYFRLGALSNATAVETLFLLRELRSGIVEALPYEVLFMIFDYVFK